MTGILIPIFIILSFLVLVYYFIVFNNKNISSKSDSNDIPSCNNITTTTEVPYEKETILDLDDYEYSLVFQNEGSRETSEAMVNYATSRYPLDWSLRPPSDEQFQTYREAFIDASQEDTTKIPSSTYNEIDGSDMVPEDTKRIKEEEMKLLKTYKPENSSELLKYSMGDVKTLVDKYYGFQGLEPVLEKSDQGDNVYEITEVKNKNEPITWEDEYEEQQEKNIKRGESQINVPTGVKDMYAQNDPFYEVRSQRMNKNDYTKWTPGLERQFAPTYPAKNWY